MKRKLLIALGCVCAICLLGVAEYDNSHYNRNGVVIALEGSNTLVEDECGYIWSFESQEYNIGDNVTMKMYTNCTDSIVSDDVVVKVKRAK